jgi:aldehyde dehydrogenase (NAD+)
MKYLAEDVAPQALAWLIKVQGIHENAACAGNRQCLPASLQTFPQLLPLWKQSHGLMSSSWTLAPNSVLMPMVRTNITSLFQQQQQFFRSGATRPLAARSEQLTVLRRAVEAFEGRLLDALATDLRKPRTEAYLSEIGLIYEEIDHALKQLEGWMKPQRVKTPWLQAPASSFIQAEPYGTVAIIAPWNYPVMLLLEPLVGALAAGNTVILKPSEYVPATSATLAAMVEEFFDPQWVSLMEGAVEETQALLALPLDYLFFTGSTPVGKIVMRAAAEHLTPVTLELGGKSPAIIDRRSDLNLSIRRVIWGKFFNLGQTCVAPDYLLVPHEDKAAAFDLMRKHLLDLYGPDPQQSPDLARIVNQRHFERLQGLISGEVVIGGQADQDDLYLAPTVIDVTDPDAHPAMQEEIFGPILPVISYKTLEEAIQFVNDRPKPLALYFFSTSSRHQERVLQETSSGGVCLNDAIVHLSTTSLPFGGVGPSGMGNYHGKASFDTFSHAKSVMKRSFLFDPAIRYPPYKTAMGLLKGAMKWLG